MDSYETFRANNPQAYAGWGDAGARADYAATHGAGKGTQGGSSSSSSGGGAPTFTAANLADLYNSAYNILKPYYLQLLKEANGDLQVAINKLQSDYQTNTRNAKIAYTTGTTDELGSLQNTLSQNANTFQTEQEKELDDLNRRGMAVYQNGPDHALNVLGVHLPTGDANPTGEESGINAPYTNPNAANLGEGGRELTQLQQDQQLRQEAEQRASNQKLQQLGITYQQATNSPTGYDLSTPTGVAQAATDVNSGKTQLSTFGSEEQNAINAYNSAQTTQRTTAEKINNEQQTRAETQADTAAKTGATTQDIQSQNNLENQQQKQFVDQGVGV